MLKQSEREYFTKLIISKIKKKWLFIYLYILCEKYIYVMIKYIEKDLK